MYNDNCSIFWIDPNSEGDCSPPADINTCSTGDCYCGYLQYESLIPYLQEIHSSVRDGLAQSTEFEFRLREQIVEISRLFDMDAGVNPGFFTKSHYTTTKTINTINTSGSRYLKIPEFVPGTLEVRTINNSLLSPSSYSYSSGFLTYKPCTKTIHRRKGCGFDCDGRSCSIPIQWPAGCYKVTARWGKDCVDMAVQMAVRDYLISTYRLQDPVKVVATGLTVVPGFKVPHSWSSYIKNFREKRALFSQFAFA